MRKPNEEPHLVFILILTAIVRRPCLRSYGCKCHQVYVAAVSPRKWLSLSREVTPKVERSKKPKKHINFQYFFVAPIMYILYTVFLTRHTHKHTHTRVDMTKFHGAVENRKCTLMRAQKRIKFGRSNSLPLWYR